MDRSDREDVNYNIALCGVDGVKHRMLHHRSAYMREQTPDELQDVDRWVMQKLPLNVQELVESSPSITADGMFPRLLNE